MTKTEFTRRTTPNKRQIRQAATDLRRAMGRKAANDYMAKFTK